jgi:addiction module HigA family antidote
MATRSKQPHRSDLAIHPGEVLADELEARSMTQRTLAEAIGRPEQAISEIIRGKKGITAETALQLSDVFGVSAEFWMNLQSTYALTLAREAAGAKRRTLSRPLRKGATPKRAATR